MNKTKLLGFFLVPIVASGLLVANVASAQTINNTAIKGPRAGMMGLRRNGTPVVTGTVASIAGNILTVTLRNFAQNTSPKIYTVDATNATVIKNNATSTLASIAIGDTIMARGTLTGTSLTATFIRDGAIKEMMQGNSKNKSQNSIIKGNGQPVIGGNVTAVSGSTLTVTNASNITYTIDASSAVVDREGATSTVSNVIVGDRIIVQGTVNGTTMTASSIIDQGTVISDTANSSGKYTGFFGAIRGFFHNVFGFF
jgi:hypothetical protein